jgi:hypothetical protein
VSATRKIQCASCRAVFDDGQWESFDLVERICADEVSRVVRGWSPTECVEVRLCCVCGKPIAAKRPVNPG